ncbi:Transcription factor myb3 [Ranunculus cassubicifolius]
MPTVTKNSKMVKAENKEKGNVTRGTWTPIEDMKLKNYITAHSHGKWKWRDIPTLAGLNRCHKSCRLRWMNYLRPGLVKGNITEEEENLIMRLHNLVGNRWAIISRRLPGRTDNEIKNFWFTHLRRRALTIRELNDAQNRQVINDMYVTNVANEQLNTTPFSAGNSEVQGISEILDDRFTFESMDDLQRFLEIEV